MLPKAKRVRPATSQPIFSLPHKGIRATLARYTDCFDMVAFAHSMLVIIGGLLSIFIELPHLRFWAWGPWFLAPTSRSQALLFTISTIFYSFDLLVILFTRSQMHKRDLGMVIHHMVTIVGLLGPLLTGRDGTLVIFGFILGECSNPARLCYQMCVRLGKRESVLPLPCLAPEKRPKTIEALRILYCVLFALSRVICAHYVAHAVLPLASLFLTKAVAIALVIFSAICIWDYAISDSASLIF